MAMAQNKAQLAYKAWLVHAMECTEECRTHGIDCKTAVSLRQALREARHGG